MNPGKIKPFVLRKSDLRNITATVVGATVGVYENSSFYLCRQANGEVDDNEMYIRFSDRSRTVWVQTGEFGAVSSALVSNANRLKNGNQIVEAGHTYTITFTTPFLVDDYTLICTIIDTDGNSQQINETPGSKTENGFEISSPVDGEIRWTAQIPQS